MKNNKKALLISALSLLLCCSILVGMTFAWFTDAAKAKKNIQAGNLDVGMYWTNDLTTGVWYNAGNEEQGVPFNQTNWEPGYTAVRYVKIVNEGDLALKYALTLNSLGQVGKLAEVIGVYYNAGVTANVADRSLAGMKSLGYLNVAVNGGTAAYGALEAKGSENSSVIVAVALKMDESAGNEYQKETIGDGFIFNLVAAQEAAEIDGFGSDYDADATLPGYIGKISIEADVTDLDANNCTTKEIVISSSVTDVKAIIPAGVKIETGATKLALEIESTTRSDEIDMVTGEASRSLDVHIEGIASDNTVPATIYLGKILPTGMKASSVKLYHVENGTPVLMTKVSELTAHNQYTYDAATGEVSISIKSFSEVTAVVAANNPWNGDIDTSWYNTTDTVFTIDTAEKLAGLGAIVGGMASGIDQDDFSGKTIKLRADIDLGGAQGRVWYPIGYHNSNKNYNKVSGGSVTSNVSSFEGTFDGQKHTISNIYQNTWDMFGDYNDGYTGTPNHYKDGMGIFGFVYNGTVKDLTVSNFQSDGEFCTTGVVAAYASGSSTFENITILNSNPRAYNVPNGGVVGYAYASDGATSTVNFNNVKVDSSNKITALWGSWDVGCGGILGRVNGATTVNMTNCEVGAVIDVFNDVCGNYQYYQYRYSGMLIGTVGGDGDPTSGAETVNFSGVKVYIGDWADYYFCEFEKNSGASYTEDFQFSRVERDDIVFNEYNMPTSCTHDHTANEDKLAVYLPFGQLYTGYGWGASPVFEHGGVEVINYFYMVTYMNADNTKVLDVEYVTDGESTEDKNYAYEHSVKSNVEGVGSTFDGWVNAGSTKVTKISAGNRRNIVLYEDLADIYTATFVDNEGNVIYRETFTRKGFTNGLPAKAPDKDDLMFSHWELHTFDDKGTLNRTTITKESQITSKNADVTLYAVYTYSGNLNIVPVDTDNDGYVNYYRVEATDDLSGTVTVPGIINGVPVKEVQDLCTGTSIWELNSSLTTVIFNEGIEEIKDKALAYTTKLNTVYLPSTLKKIGNNAFSTILGGIGGFVNLKQPITFTYNGTKAQWDAIEKASNWDQGLVNGSKLICTDGEFDL